MACEWDRNGYGIIKLTRIMLSYLYLAFILKQSILEQHQVLQSQISLLGRIVRPEQSSSIAIKLTFAPPQINKDSVNDYI